MTIADILMILAVLCGPILAVQTQKFIETWRDHKGRQLTVFKILMATRGTPVSPRHVEALNLIDLEFSEKSPKEKEVVDAWKVYLDHLSSTSMPSDYQDPSYQAKLDAWGVKSSDYLIDLLFNMSRSLGYNYDRVQLRRGAYMPKGLTDIELELSLLRRGMLDVLYGKRAIPIRPGGEVPGASPAVSQSEPTESTPRT
jgi:hypothetical protein